MQYQDQVQSVTFPFSITPLLVGKLLAAQNAVARFDERMRRSHLRVAAAHRLLYGEVCASQLREGDLVHQADLVLLDGHCAPSQPSVALSLAYQKLQVWRRAQTEDAATLLRANTPGEPVMHTDGADAKQGSVLPSWNATALREWRNVLHESKTQPPLLAAAKLSHAWSTLAPDPTGPWRSTLLAELVLRATKTTLHSMLPIELGRKRTKDDFYGETNLDTYVVAFLDWVEAAAQYGMQTLDQLSTNEAIIRHKIRNRRTSSKLPLLVDLLLSRPIVSAPLAAKELRISTQAAEKMFAQLGSNVHEVTGRKRYRAWAIA